MAKTKKDLLAEAKQKDIEVNSKMTNDEIQAAIDKGGHEVTPSAQDPASRMGDSEGEKFLKRYVLGTGEPSEETVKSCVINAVGQAKQQGVVLTDPKGTVKQVGKTYEIHVTGKAKRG